MPDPHTGDWMLVLEPPRLSPEATRKEGPPYAEDLLGLAVPLRLALTAQAAGAAAIILAWPDGDAELRRLLADRRLSLPLVEESAADDRAKKHPTVRAAANVIAHVATLRAAAALAKARSTAAGASRGEVILRPPSERTTPDDAAAITGVAGPYGYEPLAIVDPASADRAERALLRALRKPQDGWTSTHLNRPISLWFTRLLVRTPFTPNQISVGILGIGLAGAALASRGGYAAQLAGAFLFQAQSVLDGCDGEISRVTFRGSRRGEWLDTIGDDLTNYGFFAGASWGLYRSTGRPLYLLLGFITVLSGLIGSGLEYRYLVRIGSGDLLKYPIGIGKAAAPGQDPKTALGRAVDAISPLFKRDSFVLMTLVGAALGWLGPFLAIFAAGAVAVLTAVIRAELTMRRERRESAPRSHSDSGDRQSAPADGARQLQAAEGTASRVDPILHRD